MFKDWTAQQFAVFGKEQVVSHTIKCRVNTQERFRDAGNDEHPWLPFQEGPS